MSEALTPAAMAEKLRRGPDYAIIYGNAAANMLVHLAGVEAELQGVRDAYDRSCKTVALMHAAAVGEMRGPTIGVVEDVEAVRAELQQAREERTALLVNEQNLTEELALVNEMNDQLREQNTAVDAACAKYEQELAALRALKVTP
jgi:hypothetical protein